LDIILLYFLFDGFRVDVEKEMIVFHGLSGFIIDTKSI